jgi:GGDEF domain-containing protein
MAEVSQLLFDRLAQLSQDSGLDLTTRLSSPASYNQARPAAESDPGVYFIFCDLDDFGRLNKQHTHDYGDQVLAQKGELVKEVAAGFGVSLHRCFRRRHGDELIVLCPKASAPSLAQALNEADSGNEAPLSCGVGATENEAERAMKAHKASKKS